MDVVNILFPVPTMFLDHVRIRGAAENYAAKRMPLFCGWDRLQH